MKFVIESEGGVASRVQIGKHCLVFDQPPSVPGGADRGASPLDVMTAAVGACAHYFAAAFLDARKLSTVGLRVVVEAQKEKQPWPRLANITLRVELPPGVPERYWAPIQRAVSNCPAYGTLRQATETTLDIVAPEQQASAPAAAQAAAGQ
jgi:uncharacterized OsmC-like protein